MSTTAKTAQHLADVLHAAGFDALAVRASANEFHDFLSPHALPELELDAELVKLIETGTKEERAAAYTIRQRHHDGEFDASKEESDAWAASPDGQAAFNQLTKELKP